MSWKLCVYSTIACWAFMTSGFAHGALFQTFAGPYVTTGGGTGTVLVDTTSDTGNWINNFNIPTSVGTLYYSFDVIVTDNGGETAASSVLFTALQLYNGGGEVRSEEHTSELQSRL